MGARVAEINERPVAHVFRDKPVIRRDGFGDRAVIRANHLAQILGIKPCRQCGRADKVAEHHGQLPPLRAGWRHPQFRWLRHGNGNRCIGAVQLADCREQFTAMTYRADAEAD